jgi:hypothetical protein
MKDLKIEVIFEKTILMNYLLELERSEQVKEDFIKKLQIFILQVMIMIQTHK